MPRRLDYSIAFYISDGFLLLTVLIAILKLNVTVQKTGQPIMTSLQSVISVPSLLLFFLVSLAGFGWGIHDTYLYVYLNEELKAPTAYMSKLKWPG